MTKARRESLAERSPAWAILLTSGHQQTVRVPFGCPSAAILSANA
jgi:hypothetical protein